MKKDSKSFKDILDNIEKNVNILEDFPDISVNKISKDLLNEVAKAKQSLQGLYYITFTSLLLFFCAFLAMMYIFVATPNVDKPSIKDVVLNATSEKKGGEKPLDDKLHTADNDLINTVSKVYKENLDLRDSLSVNKFKLQLMMDTYGATVSYRIKGNTRYYSIKTKPSKLKDQQANLVNDILEKNNDVSKDTIKNKK